MKKPDLPYLYPKTSKGRTYWYVERFGDRTRVSEPGSPGFLAEYDRAVNGYVPIPKGKTFTKLIASYEESERYKRLAERTQYDYDKVMSFINEKMGNENPTLFKRHHVLKAQSDNANTYRFANYIVQVLRVLFEHAIDIGWQDANPTDGVRMLKSPYKRRKAWPAELVEKYRETANGLALDVFELCVGTGQRIGDVLRIQWSDIEEDGIRITQGKGGKELFIPFTSRLRQTIADLPRRGAKLLTKEDGGPVTYWTANYWVRKQREAIGALDYDIHGLRHTAASELAELGLKDEDIQAITGHSSVAMVAHYTEGVRQRARAKKAQEARE